MGGFKARNLRFCSVREIGLMDEKIIWHLKVKHTLGILTALFLVIVGGRSPMTLVLSLVIAGLVVITAIYPTKSVALETILFGAVRYTLAGRKKSINVELDSSSSVGSTESRKAPLVIAPPSGAENLQEEDVAAGLITREAVARKSGKMRRIT